MSKKVGWITNRNGSHYYLEPSFTPKPGPKETEANKEADRLFASRKSSSSGSGGAGEIILTGILVVVGIVGWLFRKK